MTRNSMRASVGSLLAAAHFGGSFFRQSSESRAEDDLQALLFRMRQRLYPETLPVLAYFWLKTVCASGYSRRRWNQLSHLLKSASCEPLLDDASREVLIEITNWIRESVVLTGQTPASMPQRLEPARASLNSEGLTAYVVRLLNGWLPMEVARLLIDASKSPAIPESGMPVQAIGIAIERLLVREHPSRETLETLLQPELLSPEYIYPADLEMLRDAVLWLLGRTWAPTAPVMPATLLCVGPNSHLPTDYREALRHALLLRQLGDEEVHVPIALAEANEMKEDERSEIGSLIVTMDGRWWKAETPRSSEQHSVVYRPGGRLRIDYSEDHTRLRMPWPDSRLRWPGGGCFRFTFKIFGREWDVSKWEMGTEGSWLHLVVSRAMSISEIVPGADTGSWRLRPASVDMAWAALESALISSLAQKSSEPIEQLRHSDLIPLGRAIVRLTESVMSRRLPTYEAIEAHLRALRYLQNMIVSAYGRVPWRILPGPVRAHLLRVRGYPALRELLNEVVEGFPEALSQTTDRSSRKWGNRW